MKKHPDHRGTRGIMLMEVMAAIAILAMALLLFAMGSVQLSKVFHETYSSAVADALRLDSLNLELRRDERASVAAFAGDGDLTLDGATFTGVSYPSQAVAANWSDAETFLSDLGAHFASNGQTLAATPSTPVKQSSWLLFLSPGGRLAAYYRYVNHETVDGDGYVTTSILVERYAHLSLGDPAMTLTYSIEVSAPGRTLAALQAEDGHARAEPNPATGLIESVLPSAFLGNQHLYDQTKLSLEAREATPRVLAIRPGFQP